LSDGYSEVDHDLINGARFGGAAMPPSNANNIELHFKLRRREQLRLTMSEAEKQCLDAQVALSAQLLSVYDNEIRSLHRERAIALLKVFACNRDIEALRRRILESGGIISHQLDGHTTRLGGMIEDVTKWNAAQKVYIDACIKLGVMQDEDLTL
jgi:hypothetical protein